MKRYLLLKAQSYKEASFHLAGAYMSEKLDGVRVFWDGGLTRGMKKSDVPWANTDKDSRYIDEQFATGLWTQYGHPVYAPDFLLNKMPKCPLDTEFFIGHKMFQTTLSVVRSHARDEHDWRRIKVMVLDAVPYDAVFAPGNIDLPHYKCRIPETVLPWVLRLAKEQDIILPQKFWHFHKVATWLLPLVLKDIATPQIQMLTQYRLPMSSEEAREELLSFLRCVVNREGEGVILRRPFDFWEPHRVRHIVKLKPYDDAEGIVVGYTAGLGKYSGMMGALKIKYKEHIFKLSGFTDAERRMSDPEWCRQHPGEDVPAGVFASEFPLGSVVTFKYRELSDDGIPKEARYWRKRGTAV